MITKPIEGGSMTLLPPRADRCQTCAGKHKAAAPHNAQSLYYQVAFEMEHGRAPTWGDAMAHCSDECRAVWTAELVRLGVDVAGGRINPAKAS